MSEDGFSAKAQDALAAPHIAHSESANLGHSSDRIILAAWYLILFSEVLNGPFRFYSEAAGLSVLVYFPKVLSAAIILSWATQFQTKPFVLLVVGVFIASATVAAVNGVSAQQIGFGFWIFQYLLVGIPLWEVIQRNQTAFLRSCLLGWAIAITGVLLNSQMTFPWVGFEYSIGGVDIEGSREWSTGEYDRLAGFGRASITSACQILALSLFVFPAAFKENRTLAISMAAISAYAIFLTTAKSVAGAYFVALVVWFLFRFESVAIFAGAIVCAITILLPFTTLFVTYRLAITSWWAQLLFLSFDERLTLTWPLSLELLQRIGDPVFGRGLGGVGSPQKIFSQVDRSLYDLSFTDSLSLFLYGTFGIFGVFILFVLSYRVIMMLTRRAAVEGCLGLAALGSILVGGATDLVEAGVPAVVIGAALVARARRHYVNI